MSEALALGFGLLSSALYLFWSVFQIKTAQPNIGVALLFYAAANIALLWPLIRKFL